MTVSAKTWARIGAVAFIAFAILVSVFSAQHTQQTPVALAVPAGKNAAALTDPLVDELFHCQTLGQAGASDPDCLRAWAENRRRFLAPGALPEAKLPPPLTVPNVDAAPAQGVQP